jgi:hypothetical protein
MKGSIVKTKLALGLLTIGATLITSGTVLAQQSDSWNTVKAGSAGSGTGDPYSAYSSPLRQQTAGEPLPAADPVQPAAAGYTKQAGTVDARTAKRADSMSSDTGGYDYYKDLAPFGE